MTAIFLSHAVADQKLVELFTSFLKEAIGVKASDIFCSSVKGHGVPLGTDFNIYMKDKIQSPKLVILLMTPAYMESAFCLMELGASWAKTHKTLPIVVSPVDFSLVTKTLGLVQAWKIDDHDELNAVKQMVVDTGITLEERSANDWDKKRANWRRDSERAVVGLSGYTKVAISTYEAAQKDIKDMGEQIDELRAKLKEQAEYIEQLKALKDKSDVNSISAPGNSSAGDEFDRLVKSIGSAFPKNVGSIVKKFIILSHYKKDLNVAWSYYRDDFMDAEQRNFLEKDEKDYKVKWNSGKILPIIRALQAFDAFMASPEGVEFVEQQDESIPMETDDVDFWEKHLHL